VLPDRLSLVNKRPGRSGSGSATPVCSARWAPSATALDNAVAESFFATLEKDLLRRRSFATRQEARTAVFDYIEAFYNPIRLHSTLDYLSPAEYEKMKERETEKAA